ncbi:hypothetical protein HG530_001236 [Fusarium avenaceum]|nr:hypothetical protein HG530_001236 [Fusarium avenaceum]
MAGVLAGVNSTEDNSAAIAVHSADVETEGAALDKALLDHAVDDQRIRRIPTVQVRTSTHDANTAIVPVRISGTVNNTTGRVQVDESATLAKMSKLRAKRGLLRLFAHGVDPEFRRACIQVDRDLLSGCSQGDVDAVEETVLLALESNFVLSLGHALYDGRARAHCEGEANKAIWGGGVGADVEGDGQRGSRDGEEKSG